MLLESRKPGSSYIRFSLNIRFFFKLNIQKNLNIQFFLNTVNFKSVFNFLVLGVYLLVGICVVLCCCLWLLLRTSMYIMFIYKMYIYIYIHGPWLLLLSSPCVHVGSRWVVHLAVDRLM